MEFLLSFFVFHKKRHILLNYINTFFVSKYRLLFEAVSQGIINITGLSKISFFKIKLIQRLRGVVARLVRHFKRIPKIKKIRKQN